MKFRTLALSLTAMLVIFGATYATARTVYPVLNKYGKPVVDKNGNCVRSKWLADQCCDPCGFPAPVQEKLVAEREQRITHIDLVRQSIYFNIDKDNIDDLDDARINEVIAEINKSAGIRNIKLVGYADRFASDKYNIDLSKRRASNVLNNFRQKGYFNNVNVGFGFFGEGKPVTNCPLNVSVPEQVACLQADRRVDIEVELLREKVEIIKEVVSTDAPPAYPRPGTKGVEVYSRPVDASTIQWQNAPAFDGNKSVPTPQVQDEWLEPLGEQPVQDINAVRR